VAGVRVINLIGRELTELLLDRFGGRIDVVELEPDSPLADDLEGEVLLAPGRAAGRPDARWLAEVARRGVAWVHVAGANVGDLPDALFEEERVVTCSRGAMASPISEFVLASMLAFEKRFPQSWLDRPPPQGWGAQREFEPAGAQPEVRLEPPPRWGYADLGTLDGKVLGIFGFGSIGRATAAKALPFGMRVVAVRRRRAASGMEGVEIVELAEMVELADHIVLAAPGTPSTERIFDDRVFARTKPGAHLVNVARGTLVDQEALIRALDEGRLAFATLDVTQPEPLPAGHPLYTHPRVHLTPHISWCSPVKQQRTAEIILENLASYLRREPLHGTVDRNERY
jgi:phosphoglycerate dehydrogenase-like enzyme